jgi:hypothetical protein
MSTAVSAECSVRPSVPHNCSHSKTLFLKTRCDSDSEKELYATESEIKSNLWDQLFSETLDLKAIMMSD